MLYLTQLWSQFLQSPKLEALTEDAKMTYITSCKQFSGARTIVNQLAINGEGLKSHHDEVICTHEGASSLVTEVASSFMFEFDGKLNPFLPGLDDNMFSGKRVEMPIVYIVLFTHDKIRDIRVFWDQATVLKQIEVIGARGRGWPVYDGPEQCRLLRAGTKPDFDAAPRGQDNRHPMSATNDPHASLQLFDNHPVEQRTDYGPQDYQEPVKPEQRNYDELFVNDASARPDELVQRQGQGHKRQVTLGQSQTAGLENGVRRVNLNESIGQAGRSSHFEFGTPDANASDFQRNEIPFHAKGGVKDHNQSSEDYYEESLAESRKARPETSSHFQIGNDSPSPALQNSNHRGPPTASFDVNSDQAPEHNIHGREYNMSRRPPPQSQYDFVSGGEDSTPQSYGRASSQRFAQSADETRNEPTNIHGREYNMSRRPPPQSQYDFVSGDDTLGSKPASRATSQRFAQTDEDARDEPQNIHGREYNMSRRPPPQAQYDFMSDSSAPQQQENFGRASQRRFTPTEEPENIHGREYNMSRRAPPQAQYDFMSDSNSEQQSQNFGRASQRNFTPSYDLGDENIHGREYNMSRRGPPAPQHNMFE